MNGFAAHRTVFERSLQPSAVKQKQFLWHWITSVSKGDIICQRCHQIFRSYWTKCLLPAGEMTQVGSAQEASKAGEGPEDNMEREVRGVSEVAV